MQDGYLDKNLSKDSKITIIGEIFIYGYKAILLSIDVELMIFAKKLIIEVIYNALLTIILYPLMQKCGYKIEEIFKNPQILTRYF